MKVIVNETGMCDDVIEVQHGVFKSTMTGECYLFKDISIIHPKIEKEEKLSFENELSNLINRYCKENDSDTPDWLLAKYLNECLEVFNSNVKRREQYYGRK